MASVKVKFRPSTIEGKTGALYFQEEFYKLKYCSTVVYMVPRA